MRMSLQNVKSAAAGIATGALLLPFSALAQTPTNPDDPAGDIQGNLNSVGGKAYGSVAGQTNLPELVGTYINAFLAILGVFFVIYIIIAGFKLFTSSDPKALGEVQNTIKNAVIGLIIIFAAYAISNFVINAVLNSAGANV
jgi:hypothetical protein